MNNRELMTKNIEGSDQWSKVINELESEIAKLQLYDKTILERLGSVQGKYILDYGAGPGIMASFLQELGANSKAYDISKDMRELAIEKVGRANIYDSVKTIPERHFDFVVCNLVLCIVEDDEVSNILRNIYHKLKNDGVGFIGFCNPKIFCVKESKLDYRFPVEDKEYENVHDYKKIKKEGGYQLIERHRPIEWYKEKIKDAGFQIKEEIFTPEYTLKGNKIRDFIIFRLSR